MQSGTSIKDRARDILVLHTSDVHISDESPDPTGYLRLVVRAAQRLQPDVLLFVGDTFDHNRMPTQVLERAAALFSEAPGEMVALPGNHDPAMENCAFRHPAFMALDRLHVLGVNAEERVRFEALDLEIWGRPHRDFGDMAPLERPPPRASRWRIVMAHGHYEARPDRTIWPRPAWLFGDEDLAGCDADYLALGHWNRRVNVGAGPVPAWYSGSSDFAGSVNLCRFGEAGLIVTQEPLG